MKRFIFIGIITMIAAGYFGNSADALLTVAEAQSVAPATAPTPAPPAETASIITPGRAEIKANRQGHFVADFRVNGRHQRGLVDTGATYVSMSETIARRLGISRSDLHYRYSVSTANGMTKAAHIKLRKVQFGRISVRDVDAYVLNDKSLDSMLIGMSFMKRLKSYSVENGLLIMKN